MFVLHIKVAASLVVWESTMTVLFQSPNSRGQICHVSNSMTTAFPLRSCHNAARHSFHSRYFSPQYLETVEARNLSFVCAFILL